MSDNTSNKKEIVIFAGDYFPHPSPNGRCLQNLIEGWKDKANITIIAYNQDNKGRYRCIDGVEYIFINSPARALGNAVEYKKGIFAKIVKVALRCWRGVKTAFKWLRYDGYYYRGCVTAVENLSKKKQIDGILAACYPFSAIYAAYICKKKFNIDYVTYIMDVNSEAKNLRKVCFLRKKYEKKDFDTEIDIMASAKQNFVSEGFLHSRAYDIVRNKGIRHSIVGFPIIGDNRANTESADGIQNKIKLFYGGAFVQGVREPQALMKLFSGIDSDDFILTLCTVGNYQNDLAHWAHGVKGVDFRGTVDRDEARQLLDEADILINVGNLNEHQVPSKIFEYFQTGKPIINLYADERQIRMFAKYPLVLNISQKEITKDDISKMIEFCRQNKGKLVALDVVKENYKNYTISYLQQIVLDALQDGGNNEARSD